MLKKDDLLNSALSKNYLNSMYAMRQPLYLQNQTFLKLVGCNDNYDIKVVTMRNVRNSGIECDDKKYSMRGSVNDTKLEESISRAKRVIYEIARCNEWDFFITLTVNSKKYDRTDLDKFHKDLTQWFRNYAKKHGIKIYFLLVPELHSDGKSWHMHGLIKGIPLHLLKQFKIGDTMGKVLADKVKNGDIVYNWLDYMNKFGFCDLEPIRSYDGVSKYITKYINKELASSVKKLNAHLYYCSRGLSRALTVKKGTMKKGTLPFDIVPDFENDYCSISSYPYDDTLFDSLLSSID